MSDLRTRIAEILYRRHATRLAFPPDWNDLIPSGQQRWLADADGIILELGLRLERGERSNSTGIMWAAGNRHTVHRWVTEWEKDDE